MSTIGKRRVLFFRDYRGFTGGHLKVRDYFEHLQASEAFEPKVYLTPGSRPDHLWPAESLVAEYDPDSADVLFVAGLDWMALSAWPGIENRKPVVNLIQHVRHGSTSDPRYQFLSRRAIRICVSEEVAEALRKSGCSHGPIYTVPNGIDLEVLSSQASGGLSDVFIAGLKIPEIARRLAELLRQRHLRVDCMTAPTDRATFIEHMRGARIVVALPNPTEGFYLPALEAMKLGKAVICPDAVGNQGFCINRQTALMPICQPKALAASVAEILENPDLERQLVSAALEVASQYTIEGERDAFLQVMATAI